MSNIIYGNKLSPPDIMSPLSLTVFILLKKAIPVFVVAKPCREEDILVDE